MTDEERTEVRIQCLNMASLACGSDCAYEFVIEAAQRYFDWVMNGKKNLKIVSSNDDPVTFP